MALHALQRTCFAAPAELMGPALGSRESYDSGVSRLTFSTVKKKKQRIPSCGHCPGNSVLLEYSSDPTAASPSHWPSRGSRVGGTKELSSGPLVDVAKLRGGTKQPATWSAYRATPTAWWRWTQWIPQGRDFSNTSHSSKLQVKHERWLITHNCFDTISFTLKE